VELNWYWMQFVGAYALRLWNVTIFILSVHWSVCVKQLSSISLKFYAGNFVLKLVDALQLPFKSELGYKCTKSVSFSRHFLTCSCCYWACPLMGKVFSEMGHSALRYTQLATEMFILMWWILIPKGVSWVNNVTGWHIQIFRICGI
jgi:hypothetical protein